MQQSKNRGLYAVGIIAFLFIIMTVGVVRAVSQISKTATTSIGDYPTPTNTPVPPTPTPHPTLPMLGTKGTQIVNLATGQPKILIGASHSIMEFWCPSDPVGFVNGQAPYDGHFGAADFEVMASWGMNTVRVPMSSVLWRKCPTYQQAIKQIVTNATNAGFYVILTMQYNGPLNLASDYIGPNAQNEGGLQYPMPAAEDVTFWRQVAAQYKTAPNVLFDLLSEPHDIDWATWLNGGPVSVTATTTGFPLYTQSGTYQAIGMQQLASAVRAIAPNVIIVGGLEYAYSLSGIVAGYAIKGVSNLVYDTHPFDYADKQPSNWPKDILPTVKKYPVIVGEFGDYTCTTNYVQQVFQYFVPLNLSMLAWSYSTGECNGPNLLADWNGTPINPYGTFIQQQMQALAAKHP